MLRKSKSKKKEFLSDKISSLFAVTPRADVEDDLVFNSKPTIVTKDDLGSDEEAEAAALSSFRIQNVKLLADISDKYAGTISSRDPSNGNEENDESNEMSFASGDDASDKLSEQGSVDEEGSDIEGASDEEGSVEGEGSNAEEGSFDEEGSVDEEEDEEDGFDLSQLDESRNESFKHMRETNVSEEVSKGNCVRNQLSIWESLLETRISLQKCLVTANKMPFPDVFKSLKKDNDELGPAVGKTKGNITNLLSRLLDLQSHLMNQYPETKTLFDKSSTAPLNEDIPDDMDEEIPSDSETETIEQPVVSKKNERKRKITDYHADLADRHVSYSKYRNTVLQKWHEKIKLTANQSKNQPVTSIISQIDFILSDRNKLIRRTQLKRSKYDIVGHQEKLDETSDDKDEEVYCEDIFDDDDFYHQLLRELIEHKSADISDPIQLSQQWIALQQLRSKLKRKIDTKATKGRRIRYVVHNKLINFMAPQKNNDWGDEAKDELFASLFGRQYENNV